MLLWSPYSLCFPCFHLYLHLVLPPYSSGMSKCIPVCKGEKRRDERKRGKKEMERERDEESMYFYQKHVQILCRK